MSQMEISSNLKKNIYIYICNIGEWRFLWPVNVHSGKLLFIALILLFGRYLQEFLLPVW